MYVASGTQKPRVDASAGGDRVCGAAETASGRTRVSDDQVLLEPLPVAHRITDHLVDYRPPIDRVTPLREPLDHGEVLLDEQDRRPELLVDPTEVLRDARVTDPCRRR